MSKTHKTLYGIGAAGLLAYLWMSIPADQVPAEVWGIGLKVRLIGFVAIALLACYFFFDKVLGGSKKGP